MKTLDSYSQNNVRTIFLTYGGVVGAIKKYQHQTKVELVASYRVQEPKEFDAHLEHRLENIVCQNGLTSLLVLEDQMFED